MATTGVKKRFQVSGAELQKVIETFWNVSTKNNCIHVIMLVGKKGAWSFYQTRWHISVAFTVTYALKKGGLGEKKKRKVLYIWKWP